MNRKHISFKGIDLHYQVRGEGRSIVLLHGYLESMRIWEDFISLLEGSLRVICVDLPGHGLSGTWGEVHSMEDLADGIRAVVRAEGLSSMVLAGHSMGGYVAMAFAERHPECLSGYVLFHSTCFADNEDKQRNRDREISLIRCGRLKQIVDVNIPKAFADENLEKLSHEVERAKAVALGHSADGIVALLNGMKTRKERSAVLSDPSLPLLLIRGEQDNYIPKEVMDGLQLLAPHARMLSLTQSGHMGFVEEAGAAADGLIEFVASCQFA